MEHLSQFIDMFLHLDVHLNSWVAALGPWIYLLLFAIIFCETGVVVMPFLPGDSLLFALGAMAATTNSSLNYGILFVSLFVAAVLGDAVNYKVGSVIGPRVFVKDYRWLNKKHLAKTQEFYVRHGGKTVIWARFMPIVRTFAPFVAGVGSMPYKQFVFFNITGAFLWVGSFLTAGFFFGHLPAVKTNFHYVILGIIVVSFLPLVIEVLRAQFGKPSEPHFPRPD